MDYTAWSVIYGEQPSASKWNLLGSNDAAFYSALTGGWIEAGETWTYASASTFTVSGDVTDKLRTGVKIRLKQGGSFKYFIVVTSSYSAPNTTVTVQDAIDGATYTIANSTITDNAYSMAYMPAAFPLTSAFGSFAAGNGWISAQEETWTYASADDPTYTYTISGDKTSKYNAGMRIRVKQGGSYLYFIITAVSHAAGTTTVTIYGGTDYDLANATITDNYYSMVKSPVGFPMDKNKWTQVATDGSLRSQATPTASVWYNLGSLSLSIPIGVWEVEYFVGVQVNDATPNPYDTKTTLSTANNSDSDNDFTLGCSLYVGTSGGWLSGKRKILTLAAKTIYYLNTQCTASGVDTLYNRNDYGRAVIRATCAYL